MPGIQESTVMFTDVVGSVPLFEKHGDEVAKSAIDDCIQMMLEIVKRFEGQLVRTIGDEIMCRFSHPDNAVEAACEINNSMNIPFGPERLYLKVRTGLHSGSIIIEDDDIYGDAVNVAARMAKIAKSQQIITTEDTFNKLSHWLQVKSREFDKTAVKGKRELVTIYDIIWESENDLTCVVSASNIKHDSFLELSYMGNSIKIKKEAVPFSIGRSHESGLSVTTELASRSHVTINYSRGKFEVVDNSTNGTYIKIGDDESVYIRQKDFF